jgi:hypothetical protein
LWGMSRMGTQKRKGNEDRTHSLVSLSCKM